MKKYLLSLVVASLALTAFGQVSTTASRFTYQLTTESASLTSDLFYQDNKSVFVIYDKELKQANDTATSTSSDGSNHTLIKVNVSDGKDLVTYKDLTTSVMISRELLLNGKKYIVNDSVPRLAWTLKNEKKRIGPYDCQKATTTFRCADYIVWFTTAVPLSIGPWKLGGLPGLIVEATNTTSNFRYVLLTAEYPSAQRTYPITPPNSQSAAYSFVDFAKVQQKEVDKMVVYLKSMAGNSPDAKVHLNMQECYNGQ